MSFDIRKYIPTLKHHGRGRYDCPVCGSKNFTINKQTGAYSCWSNHCSSADIRQAIAPIDKSGDQKPETVKRPPKPKAKPVVITEPPTWSTLPGDRTYPQKERIDTPNWAKRDIKSKQCIRTIYDYGEDKEAIRLDGDDAKTLRPFFKGKIGKGDSLWDAYRLGEALDHGAGNQWIFAVEGEKTVEAMRYIGLPCITWQGGAWTEKNFSEVIVRFKFFTVAGIIYIPDHDDAGYKKADKVLAACASHSFPCLILNPLHIYKDMPEKGDIADFVVEYKRRGESPADMLLDITRAVSRAFEDQKAEDEITPATPEPMGDRQILAETTKPLKPNIPESQSYYRGTKDLKIPELDQLIRDSIGDHLKFDDLRCEVLLDDQVFTFDAALRIWFYHKFGEVAPKEDIYATMLYYSKRNSFNPVMDYLTRCQKRSKPISIDDIATRYFGTSQPIYDRMAKMWLISCVARMFDPGAQVDHTLILQSGQGKYKSTFFKILGGEWFEDSVKDIDRNDTNLTLHSSWIIELSELDRITGKKQAGAIKHFLTKRQDTFRKPYGKEVERHNRRAVFCGTVNPTKFLVDDENRRFWVIPIADHISAIDIDRLGNERDGIWASAVDAYLKGELWYPTDEEKAEIAALNRDFRDIDVWAEPIGEWIGDRPYVSTFEILNQLFEIEVGAIQKRDQMRVSKVLDMLGWTKSTRRLVRGKYRNVRVNPLPVDDAAKSLFSTSTPITFNNNSSEVSKVGISTDTKGVQDYRPTYRPDNEVGIPQGQYLPTPENEVRMNETPVEQGLDRPTDLDRAIPAKYSRAGFIYPVGTKCYIRGTTEKVTIMYFVPPKGRLKEQQYYCLSSDGHEDCIKQADLIPVDAFKNGDRY